MRKLMRFPARLSFRALLLLLAAFLLLVAFAPAANAALIRFYDFEGLRTSGSAHNFDLETPFASSEAIFDITSSSLTYGSFGNGYDVLPIRASGSPMTINLPEGTALNITNVVLGQSFTSGQSYGNNLQSQVDNAQISGTIVPEPSTVATGLLGVLGLCWFQRKRVIRSIRFGRT
jgi:hypothetical protein